MNVRITITNWEGNVTGPFDLYSNSSESSFDTGVTLAQLEAGYTVNAPAGTTSVRILATAGCGSKIFYCTQLTKFYYGYTYYVNTETVCTDDTIIWVVGYHDGSHPYPDTTDMVYSDELGTNLIYSSDGTIYYAYSSTGVDGDMAEGWFSLTAGRDAVQDFAPCATQNYDRIDKKTDKMDKELV